MKKNRDSTVASKCDWWRKIESPLFTAIHEGDLDRIKKGVSDKEEGFDVMYKDCDHLNCLSLAALLNQEHAVMISKFLLEQKADVNATDIDGESPLHAACIQGNPELVSLFIEHKADVNIASYNNCAEPLECAVRGGNPEVIKVLVENGADINKELGRNNFPLNIAIQQRQYLAFEYLLEAKADPTLKTSAGPLLRGGAVMSVPFYRKLFQLGYDLDKIGQGDAGNTHLLSTAISTGNLEMFNFLVDEAKVDIHWTPKNYAQGFLTTAAHSRTRASVVMLERLVSLGLDPNVYSGRPRNSNAALASAAASRNLEAVQLLIRLKADVNPKNSQPPLTAAVSSGSVQIVQFLLESKAKVYPEASTRRHQNPFVAAVQSNCIEIVRLFVEHGTDLNQICQNYQQTPLGVAANQGYLDMCKELVELKADPHARQNNGQSILANLVSNQTAGIEVLKYFVEELGLPVNQASQYGQTPLMQALSGRNLKTARLLIENGADLHGGGRHQHPLAVCISQGFLDGIRLLQEFGLDVATTFLSNNTPLHAACQSRRLEVLCYLIACKCDVNAQTNYNGNPLTAAAQFSLDAVMVLLDNKVERTLSANFQASSAQSHVFQLILSIPELRRHVSGNAALQRLVQNNDWSSVSIAFMNGLDVPASTSHRMQGQEDRIKKQYEHAKKVGQAAKFMLPELRGHLRDVINLRIAFASRPAKRETYLASLMNYDRIINPDFLEFTAPLAIQELAYDGRVGKGARLTQRDKDHLVRWADRHADQKTEDEVPIDIDSLSRGYSLALRTLVGFRERMLSRKRGRSAMDKALEQVKQTEEIQRNTAALINLR